MSYKTHFVIPDSQIRPGVSTDFLTWIGKYIVHRKPDVIVHLGDFADMHSLSSYDQGKKAGEGARYEADIKAAKDAMAKLLAPINKYNEQCKKNKKAQYKPRMVMCLGNHEQRCLRHVENYPYLDGKLSIKDLGYEEFGWEVHPFLEVVEIDGIKYSHFFPRSANGRIMQTRNGAPNAQTQVRREMSSCTAGHMQGLDWHVQQTGNRIYYGLIAGSCYEHEEAYLSPQGTSYWRGVIVKHEVKDGEYNPMFVSLNYLKRRYGK